MIKKLQQKFILVILSVFVLMLTVILSLIYSSTSQSLNMRQFSVMREIADRDGRPPKKHSMPPQKFAETSQKDIPPGGNEQDKLLNSRYFCIQLDFEQTVLERLIPEYLSDSFVSTDTMDTLLASALKYSRPMGKISNWQYLMQKKPYGSLIVFWDIETEQHVLARLKNTLIFTGFFCLIPLFFISLFLTRWLIRPVQDAFQKQKQFISDSSHELKTPLTVITTNADVLQSEIGENKWLSVIQSEAVRMSDLVNTLLTLARAEDSQIPLITASFSLSDAVFYMALSFESIAFEAGKQYELDIEENITYTGNEADIKQIVSVLIDNAIKNADERGLIRITLKKSNGHILFAAANTGKEIPESEKDKIFERFYRTAQARERSGGSYGLGLAIARALAEKHHGKITVENKTGMVVFTLLLEN